MNYGIYQVELCAYEHYEYWEEYYIENDYNYIELIHDIKSYLSENGGYILYNDVLVEEIKG